MRANLENNFVYFLRVVGKAEERGQSYSKYLFILDEMGDVSPVASH